ncbi:MULTISPECIES: S-layer homology domain-containing protein [Aneurinibacillus]|uniref:S-layer homology domain-containing protein n=1 Tax=Aneurinibacillus thermoaerophilus TaxID=143495 RepID=A0A1G7ZYE2_ANETH|nr:MULTISPECIES: S-layer homology domain-containing protein [Aneurinibacillus]AMA71680.1 hypothetical protein ACH33_01720 [Aneurinibacillus sp. XH2]MED0676130.1 S-layer homology domain-containing protein [Aneurinibacillus thermoaerophilus]MED0680770.1 S-layer homology domain-containing protein [Aneurinibacillus thermoaerophilus]MED0738395.1 S-layer homology domain-containing protein [Aneurinibacillus thermoaerophilus]MED0757667.1 S-layer homology domain-containing protein [Aneurinibacillus the
MNKKNGFRHKLALSLLATAVAMPSVTLLPIGWTTTAKAATEDVTDSKVQKMKELLQQLTPEEQQMIKEKAMQEMLESPNKPLEQIAEEAVKQTVDTEKYEKLKQEVRESNITIEDVMQAKDQITASPNEEEEPAKEPIKEPVTEPVKTTEPAPEKPEQLPVQPAPEKPAKPEDKPVPAFTDLGEVPWAQEAIQALVAAGVLNGISEDKFEPLGHVTRAQFTRMLVQALKLNEKTAEGPSPSFTDVKNEDWFAADVAIAARLHIVSGVSKTKFDPNAPVTREQMATMVARALDVTMGIKPAAEHKKQLEKFADRKNIATWAQANVALLVEKGIITGMDQHHFAPKSKTNRAQVAVIIQRLLDVK